MTHPTLVAIVTFNEGDKLQRVLEQFTPAMPYDILVVDDGSTDQTQRTVAEFPITVIRHDTNRGVGASIRDAIYFGRRHGHRQIVIMAGNGKMLPGEIARLTDPIVADRADYVQGSRNLSGGTSPNLPFSRKVAIKLFTMIVNLILGKKTTDVTCGFRAYRLDLFDNPAIKIDQSWLDRYEFEYYIHYRVLTGRFRYLEVPVSMVYPESGRNYSKIRPFTGWWSILRPWVFLTLRLRK